MIGDNIKKERKKANITQKELGEMIGLTGVAIMRYEKGQREPNQKTIEKIAKALKVSPLNLLSIDSWESKLNTNGVLTSEVTLIEEIQAQYGSDTVQMVQYFNELNENGKRKALENVSDLSEIPKYTK